MMDHMRDDVLKFHQAFGALSPHKPTWLSPERLLLRKSLIAEEHGEMLKGFTAWDMVEVADGLTDTLYVLVGTLIEYGLPMRPINVRLVIKGPPGFPDRPRQNSMREILASCYSQLWAARTLDGVGYHLNYLISAYVSIAGELNIPLPACWAEVQRANMSKMEKEQHEDDCAIDAESQCTCGAVLYRDDGKILKGSRYTPPDILMVLRMAGWIPTAEQEPAEPFEAHKT